MPEPGEIIETLSFDDDPSVEQSQALHELFTAASTLTEGEVIASLITKEQIGDSVDVIPLTDTSTEKSAPLASAWDRVRDSQVHTIVDFKREDGKAVEDHRVMQILLERRLIARGTDDERRIMHQIVEARLAVFTGMFATAKTAKVETVEAVEDTDQDESESRRPA